MSEMKDKLTDTIVILSILAVLVTVGIVWMILFGNLSNNVGFGRQSSTFINQTITLQDAGAMPAGGQNRSNLVLTGLLLTNASSGVTVATTNYTSNSTGIFNAAANPTAYNGSSVNVTFIATYDSQGLVDTQTVIQNGTLGFKTFFGNMPTIFQIAAVVLLITMVVGLLFLIIAVVKKLNSSDGFGGGSGFNGYN